MRQTKYPGERVDVICELGMFLQFRIVGNSPETMLIEKARQGKIGFQIDDGLIVGLGVNKLFLLEVVLAEGRSKIRRFCRDSVETFVRGRITILLASKPNIVWDSNNKWDDKSITAVQRLDCSKSVLEVIPSGGVQEDTIEFKPRISQISAPILPDSPKLS